MRVKLRVNSGTHAGRQIEVTSEKFLIGRSDSCQLRPKSESVSRKHCVLVMKEGRLLLQDLNSRNGTFINDKRLPPDKAKVLKDADVLRVGKLTFLVEIEHGLQAAKKPPVQSVADAAARSANAGSSDSRFEEVDVTSWLDEADQIDRVRKQNDPETRQFALDGNPPEGGGAAGDGAESDDLSVSAANDDTKDTRTDAKSDDTTADKALPERTRKPGKLPDSVKKAMKENSRDAADDALKKFFSGR